MATYSNNTTIKINGSVSYSNPGFTASGTIYTGAANKYTICNVWIQNNGSRNTYIYVGGKKVAYQDDDSLTPTQITIYSGPGQSITWQSNGVLSAGDVEVSGVEFINTP
jgi:hypothetical protein